jgi:hypothetical protein
MRYVPSFSHKGEKEGRGPFASRPAKAGTHNHNCLLWMEGVYRIA